MSDMFEQHNWSEDELKQAGFKHYPRKKQVVMVRTLKREEAPMRIKTDQGDTLIAQAGYKICYNVPDAARPTLADYEQWPCEPEIFAQTYREWDEILEPTPAVEHLMALGCRPFYKIAGIWAKELDQDAYIQSIEHEEPVKVQRGRRLVIGSKGEPYHMSDQSFANRYDTELSEQDDSDRSSRGLLKRLLRFFKND